MSNIFFGPLYALQKSQIKSFTHLKQVVHCFVGLGFCHLLDINFVRCMIYKHFLHCIHLHRLPLYSVDHVLSCGSKSFTDTKTVNLAGQRKSKWHLWWSNSSQQPQIIEAEVGMEVQDKLGLGWKSCPKFSKVEWCFKERKEVFYILELKDWFVF